MKLGDIKIEALKLMFVNHEDDIDIASLKGYEQDEVYQGYLINMPGSFNRCFSNLEEKRVLPSKSRILKSTEGVQSGPFLRFDLSALIADFFDIDRLIMESEEGDYDGDCDYKREGNVLVLEQYRERDGIRYTLLYKPVLERITAQTENDTILPIPDQIACHIPYFIKGDLYREDEPNEAGEARNWFEQAMREILWQRELKSSSVKSIYAQTE